MDDDCIVCDMTDWAKFLICDKWELNIREDLIGNPSILESNKHSEYPFLFLMNRKGYDVAYGAWAYEYIARNHLGDYNRVLECCGGIGRSFIILENLLNIKERHTLLDVNCVTVREHLLSLTNDAHCCNYLDWKENNYDLVCIDNNSFTIKTMMQQTEQLKFLLSKCRSAIITDTAISKLHLHNNLYASLVDGKIVTIDDYYKAIANYALKYFSLILKAVVYHPRASYMLYTRNPLDTYHIIPVPKEEANGYFRRFY